MGAPTGNQFWKLRSKHGRDKLFENPELLKESISDFFQWCDLHPKWKNESIKSGDMAGKTMKVHTERPYTLSGLCVYLGCNSKYFNDFEDALRGKTDKISKDFSEVIGWAKEVMYTQKFEGAAIGAFNANIISRDLGLADRSESRFVDRDGNDIYDNKSDEELKELLNKTIKKLDG